MNFTFALGSGDGESGSALKGSKTLNVINFNEDISVDI